MPSKGPKTRPANAAASTPSPPTFASTAAPTGTPLRRAQPDDRELPARYTVLAPIGFGGMGIVYQAQDTHLQRLVAIKIFEPGARTDPLNEARLTARLAHPNIMPIYDAGMMPDGCIWQSMQLIEGRDLTRVLADPAVGIRRMIDLLVRVAQAIAYAHAHGVVHRDLKPANIRVDTYDRVFVLDWGIAARMGAHAPSHHTPRYAPPEQINGEIVAPGFDVFALGKLLDDILIAAGDAHVEAKPLYALSARCTAAPTTRLKTGKAFADALLAWLDGAQRRGDAEALVGEADAHLHAAERLRAQAEQVQDQADVILAALKLSAHWSTRKAAWTLEAQAATNRVEAENLSLQAEHLLQAALRRFDRLPTALARLEALHAARLTRAEAIGDATRIAECTARLRALATDSADALLDRPGTFSLATAPAGARVMLAPLTLQHRRWVAGDEVEIGTTPIILEQPPGRYRVRLLRVGYAPVVVPIRLHRGGQDRGVAPGETAPHPIALQPVLSDAECYVPAGWFQSGGDPHAADCLPGRQIWVDGFVIETVPLTYRRFIKALNALCADGQADRAATLAHLPETDDAHACLRRDEAGVYFVDSLKGTDVLDWPVTQISWTAASAWADLQAEQTGLPWRLPDELEREKAARGTDGRMLPWGDHFEPTWACVSVGRRGPPSRVSVFETPLDVSVYGVLGLAGNVRDWCRNGYTKTGTCAGDRLRLSAPCSGSEPVQFRVLRGGYFSGPPELARSACRYAADPVRAKGYMSAGVRLVRSI